MRTLSAFQVGAILALSLSAFFLSACKGGYDAGKVASQYDKLFQSADPESQGLWHSALAAVKTNGFAAALQNLEQLLQQTNITPEQASAVRETSKTASEQMYAAANKGDANALQSIQDLRKTSGH